ncbi:MAG: SelB C-terminal domain-containing protein [Armatimonadota bacterium]|nr:SelB C-terminal domain-containing protein [Armatimonadota bacterium]MDR5697487.1 SelB C-terminal domain-containing protein [Armatimonadota bacterium]
MMMDDGEVVELRGLLFDAAVVRRAAGSLGVGQARDTVGGSRKYMLALLEHLDGAGVTRRRGDVRVAGPNVGRLPVERSTAVAHNAGKGEDGEE